MIPPANAYKHTKQWFNCSSIIKQKHKTYTAATATSHQTNKHDLNAKPNWYVNIGMSK